MRCTERSDTPLAAAIARPVQCVVSPRGSPSVSATTRSTTAGGKGGSPGLRVLSHQPGHACAHEPLLPAPDAGLGHLGPAHDLGRAAARRRRQDDPRPPDVLLRAVPIRHDPLQPATVRSAHLDADPFAHAAACHASHAMGIL